jgi:hypothetical protein
LSWRYSRQAQRPCSRTPIPHSMPTLCQLRDITYASNSARPFLPVVREYSLRHAWPEGVCTTCHSHDYLQGCCQSSAQAYGITRTPPTQQRRRMNPCTLEAAQSGASIPQPTKPRRTTSESRTAGCSDESPGPYHPIPLRSTSAGEEDEGAKPLPMACRGESA